MTTPSSADNVDQQGTYSVLKITPDEAIEESRLDVTGVEQQIRDLHEQAGEILPTLSNTELPITPIPYRLKDCQQNLLLWAHDFDDDGNMFDDLKEKKGVVREQLIQLVDRWAEIQDHLSILQSNLKRLENLPTSE